MFENKIFLVFYTVEEYYQVSKITFIKISIKIYKKYKKFKFNKFKHFYSKF